jgi:MFS family permease
VVAIVVIFGLFMSILDTTIVNNAISRLQTAFGASLSDVNWVSTGYTLTEGVGATLAPFFSARLGIKRFYNNHFVALYLGLNLLWPGLESAYADCLPHHAGARRLVPDANLYHPAL